MRRCSFRSLLVSVFGFSIILRRPLCVFGQQGPVFLNCGGSNFTDAQGNVWLVDTPFVNTGNAYSTNSTINGTDKPTLYKTERWDSKDSTVMTYKIPVANGQYQIFLHFAEIFVGAMRNGSRIFDVKMEDVLVFDNLDIFQAVGGNVAHIKSTQINVNDGFLTIEFLHVVGNPKISGIEVKPVTGSGTPPSLSPTLSPTQPPVASPTPPPTLPPVPSLMTQPPVPSPTPPPTLSSTLPPVPSLTPPPTLFPTPPPVPSPTPPPTLSPTLQPVPSLTPPPTLFPTPPTVPSPTPPPTLSPILPPVPSLTPPPTLFPTPPPVRSPTPPPMLSPTFLPVPSPTPLPTLFPTTNPTRPPVTSPTPPPTPPLLSVSSPTPPPTLVPISSPVTSPTPISTSVPEALQTLSPTSSSVTFPPPDPVKIFINTGSSSHFTDNSTGNIWEADRDFNTGRMYGISRTISGATPQTQQLYRTERRDTSDLPQLSYSISVPPGEYSVTLHFAETYFGSVGRRVFHVEMEGTRVLSNYDVFKAAGNRKDAAITETKTLTVDDGVLTILFIAVQDNPMISGIEIRSLSLKSVVPWVDLNESESYAGRHECSFVQAGDKFYLFGGRESPQRLDVYDYTSNTWSLGAPVPMPFNHFQATEHEGLIWVIGAFKSNSFPVEVPETFVYVYDPAKNVWMQGPRIPAGRERGGGGLVVYNGRFYLVGGNTRGHDGGFVPWLDEYNPVSGQWRILRDAPRPRDHFHAAVMGNRLYAAGGRRTTRSNTFGDTVPEVDVFDFNGEVWLTTGLPDNLPMPRAGTATAVFDGKIVVIGGESGASTLAHKFVDALDPTTGVWSALSPLKYARHGTQAIASGQGVYIVAGSPKRGDGNQRNMEVYNRNIPFGAPSLAGALSVSSSLDVPVGFTTPVSIQHIAGNQGVLINSVTLAGERKEDFNIIGGFNSPLLIPQGAALDIFVLYTGTLNGSTVQLGITFGSNQFLSVKLVGRASAATPTPLPTMALLAVPTTLPTPIPEATPTPMPTSVPVATPTPLPTPAPVAEPTPLPTPVPVVAPTLLPTLVPLAAPIPLPTPVLLAAPVPLPTPVPTSVLSMRDIIIVNATSDLDISSVTACNGCLNPTISVNFRAEPFGAVKSVRLAILGPNVSLSRLENVAPYALFGDIGGNYEGRFLKPGGYTIFAQAFDASNGMGTAGPLRMENFTI